MNGNVKNLFTAISDFKIQLTLVRYRYYADKIAKGPIAKKYGYVDKLYQSGPLARLKNADPVKMPVYRPGNAWTEEKVRKGQNDYIDILGGNKLKPPEISYEVPKWLRGRRGNEMQLLAIKQKVYANTLYEVEMPTAFYNMKRRFMYLYRYLNRKQKTGFNRRE